ncbi:pentapeptide repeat-containing protein [Maridesulfovibrio frigidus]|uniref:pentapeptide repeat-containing protein n=1 Tax=Maridesulfovibrio frigidus TaxID=340956 RepID=UPI0004E26EFE|nr:pentapeptide repeat-containing protein [Maridesulfovibrio frigidus]
MACCIGADYNDWCKDYDIIYVDGDGKEYCIFHAPAEHKYSERYVEGEGQRPDLMSGDDFNGLVFARIQAVIDAEGEREQDKVDLSNWNPRCNFAGTIFFANISFTKFKKNGLPSIDFRSCKFLDTTTFNSCTFRGLALFGVCVFQGNANFDSCEFQAGSFFFFSRFKGRTIFESCKFQQITSFTNCKFNHEISFDSSQFHKEADFTSCQFREITFFNSCNFNGISNFTLSQFRKKTKFYSSRFQKTMNLDSCQFRSIANFNSSQFYEKANFNLTQFRGLTNFNYTQFCMEAVFNHTQFRLEVDFLGGCFKKISFYNAEARNQINFKDSTFGKAIFDNMKFIGPLHLEGAWFLEQSSFNNAIFHEYSNFKNSEFYDEINFRFALFKEWSYFKNVIFNQKASFAGTISKETILIEATNLSKLSLSGTNIESFKFVECGWPEVKGIKIVYDEKIKPKENNNVLKLEDTYRRLKKISRDNNDEILASAWHYKEKEMLRKRLHHENKWKSPRTLFLRTINNIYWIISGYGEEPLRAFAFLFLFILCPLLTALYFGPFYEFTLCGEVFKDNTHLVSRWLWYLPLTKIELTCSNISDWNYFFKAFYNLLVTIQAALFAFALRNKFRR